LQFSLAGFSYPWKLLAYSKTIRDFEVSSANIIFPLADYDIVDYEEYHGEPLANYLSDEDDMIEDTNTIGNLGNGNLLGDASDGQKSYGPLSPLTPTTELDEPVEEEDNLKRSNPDDLPDITPRKRMRSADGGNRTPAKATNATLASTTAVNTLGGGDVTDAPQMAIKQEPVENEVSSTSQRDLRRPSLAASDTLEAVDSEADCGGKKRGDYILTLALSGGGQSDLGIVSKFN
jgi:hypothetical protein